jgi:23S rRNA (adenine2503-C2)-methyltransferase
MIDGVNDSMAQAEAFADLVHGFPAHVNLIPLNPVQGYPGAPSPKDKLYAFRSVLEERGISVTMRLPRGTDIQAGCGQLKAARR